MLKPVDLLQVDESQNYYSIVIGVSRRARQIVKADQDNKISSNEALDKAVKEYEDGVFRIKRVKKNSSSTSLGEFSDFSDESSKNLVTSHMSFHSNI